METGEFLGYPTRVLENQFVRLEVLTGGPRIVRLSYRGGTNLFAELPGTLETEYGDFHFLGGHRLWHSPEAMPRTYLPDIGEAQIEDLPDGIRITRPPEPGSGLVKRLEVRLDPQQAAVGVRHELVNRGLWPLEFAPWALSMMRLGGVGILPQASSNVDTGGLVPNRNLVFWPYTRINDDRLSLDDDFVTLRATPGLPPFKLGYFNPHGWMAYWIDGILFVKNYEACPGASFPDGGCNTETYCNDQFVELETLGPLERLEPGKSRLHVETWKFYDDLDQPFIPSELKERLQKG